MSLEPDCLARLKLRQQPFDGVPSEEFLYSDPLLESLIETAVRALMAPGAIVLLAGVLGSGRSIQLMRLLGALDDGFELIAFRGRSNIAFDAIDATIRNHLHAGGFDDPQRSLTELLGARARAGAAVVLAIDDAHLIGGESIRHLLRIRTEILESGGQGLRLVLVGDQSFSRASLPLPDPLDDAQVVRLNLRPFNLEQAGAYLRHRLRIAGIDDPDAFLTSGDIAVLQANSKGLPDALDKNANAWLTRRCRSVGGSTPHTIRSAGSETGAARFSAPPDAQLRALVDAGVEMPEGILELESETNDDPPARAQPLDPELSRFLVGEDAKHDSEDFEQILARVRQHQLSQTPASQSETARPVAPATVRIPDWNRRWLIPLILAMVVLSIVVPVGFQLISQPSGGSPDLLVQAPSIPSATPTPVIDLQRDDLAQMPQAQPDAQSAITAAQTQTTKDQSSVEPTSVQNANTPSSGETQPESATAQEDAKPPERRSPMQEDLDWLARQDAGRFTVQLVAARDLATAKAFLAQHDLSGIHYIQTRSYVIALLGSFPSRALASAIVPELPQAVRENGPWTRTIGSIRDSLP